MPRYSLIGGKCKIRKRGCSSSSSASSVMQNYRFKRALLINKRGGSSTPVPKWRMSSRSPGSILKMPESPNGGGGSVRKGKPVPVSARKLAASLWEMNEMNSPQLKENWDERRVKKESRSRETTRSVQSGYFPRHLSDPSHSPVSERIERSGIGSHLGRASNVSQKIRHKGHRIGGFDSISNASFMEIETRSRKPTPTDSIVGVKTHLKDLSNGLNTSKELLIILSRMWGIKEHNSSGKSIVSALRAELEKAREQADHLIQGQHSNHKEIDYLMKHFSEEKAAWKKKAHEKVETAVKSISSDLEMERKLRKRTESLTKSLARELAETKAALSNVVEELENEKRSREMMEQVSGELARSIAEDRAFVEQLKQELMQFREELEKEREMLQVADVIREERVQMKLLDAKYQFEEKNAALDKLKNKLEALLQATEAKVNLYSSPNSGSMEIGGHFINTLAAYRNQENEKGKGEIEEEEECKDIEVEDDSTESDLHSIELNMENYNRNHVWNYANGTAQEDQKRRSVDKEIKGRKSTSGKMPRGRPSLSRCTSDGIEWDFSRDNCANWGDGYDQGTCSKTEKQTHAKKQEVERQRHKSIKDLRDYIWSNSRLAPANGFASPKKQWGEL